MPLSAPELLNRDFLEIRARLLEVAAALDRLDRAEGDVAGDPRIERIRQALTGLNSGRPDRAERVQLLFSLPYESGWLSDDIRSGMAAPRTSAK